MKSGSVLPLLAMLAACSPASAAERAFPATGFDRVAASGSEDVTIVTGRAAGVVARGPADRLDRLDIRVEGGTLKIGHKRGDWSWGRGEPVRITVTLPALHGVRLSGSGNLTADRGSGPAFAASVSGSGDLSVAQIDAASVALDLSGSGDLTATGRCRAATVALAGSGDMHLGGLACETATVSLAGSGDIDARVSRTATVNIAGSGDVVITGGARCTTRKAGSGEVRCS
jgi:Putative auto-transporter adhesin, head GIN domain